MPRGFFILQKMNLEKRKDYLPANIEELATFVLIGRDKLDIVRSQIKAMDKLELAEDVRLQKKEEAQMLAEALLDAEVRIGEILNAMPKATKGNQYTGKMVVDSGVHNQKPKLEAAQELGFDAKQVQRFQTLAANKDLVEQIKQEARDADDLPTRTAVLQAAKARSFNEQREAFVQKVMDARINSKHEHCYMHGDAIEKLKELQDGSIDIVITDPPYGISYKSNRSQHDNAITKRGLLNDERDNAFDVLNATCEILFSKCADNSHLYFFCSWSVFSEFERIIGKYFTIKTPIVWDKGNKGSGDLENDWGNQTEIIIFCVKGKKTINCRKGNIISVPRLHSSKMVHPTQKPLDVINSLLEVSYFDGDFVVDPFMGSGTTIHACNKRNIKSLGIELDYEMYKIATTCNHE
ncbi:MAG: site-specific DNA-methyltransferase [Cytophagia bacterium]|nr:site-specific DNA-methyltransferase [Cytophagia bacterium]